MGPLGLLRHLGLRKSASNVESVCGGRYRILRKLGAGNWATVRSLALGGRRRRRRHHRAPTLLLPSASGVRGGGPGRAPVCNEAVGCGAHGRGGQVRVQASLLRAPPPLSNLPSRGALCCPAPQARCRERAAPAGQPPSLQPSPGVLLGAWHRLLSDAGSPCFLSIPAAAPTAPLPARCSQPLCLHLKFNEAFVEGDFLYSIMDLCLGGSLDSAIRCAWLAPARPAPARPAVRRRLASPLRTPNRTCLHAPCVPPAPPQGPPGAQAVHLGGASVGVPAAGGARAAPPAQVRRRAGGRAAGLLASLWHRLL